MLFALLTTPPLCLPAIHHEHKGIVHFTGSFDRFDMKSDIRCLSALWFCCWIKPVSVGACETASQKTYVSYLVHTYWR